MSAAKKYTQAGLIPPLLQALDVGPDRQHEWLRGDRDCKRCEQPIVNKPVYDAYCSMHCHDLDAQSAAPMYPGDPAMEAVAGSTLDELVERHVRRERREPNGIHPKGCYYCGARHPSPKCPTLATATPTFGFRPNNP